MMMDGFDLIGSSGTNAQLTFRKENFTITYSSKGEGRGVVANVTETGLVDDIPQFDYQSFDRLEKAVKYVNEKLKVV